MLKNVSLRLKIILAPILMVTLVSVFIYTYYPYQQKHAAIETINSKLESISNMFAIGIGIGMGETDIVAVSEALNWAKSDSSVIYVSVKSNNGQEIISYDPSKIELPKETGQLQSRHMYEKNNVLYYESSISYQGVPFGSLMMAYSLENLDRNIAALRRTTLYFCLSLFAMGVALSFVTSNRITGNIRKLDSAVKAVSGGIENARVYVKSDDEIGKLAKAFNRMIDKVATSREELVEYSKQLEKQNRELNQFSYVVSHDLKAPLRAIFKLSEWIEEDLGKDVSEDVRNNMQTLRGRVTRLEGLINGLLEYSKIGKVNIKPEKVNVQAMLKDILEMLVPPPHITVNIQPGMPVFNTRKILLQQVLSNLIANAVKYNDKLAGTVNVEVKELDRFYEFSVQDNGIGIAPAYHEKIFVIFQTLEARDKVEGTGIGLSIIKKIVEDIGGAIWLESEPGKGSKFFFTWPKEENTINSQAEKQVIRQVITI